MFNSISSSEFVEPIYGIVTRRFPIQNIIVSSTAIPNAEIYPYGQFNYSQYGYDAFAPTISNYYIGSISSTAIFSPSNVYGQSSYSQGGYGFSSTLPTSSTVIVAGTTVFNNIPTLL